MSGPQGEQCLDCYWFDQDGLEDIKPDEISFSLCRVEPRREREWPEVMPSDWCGRFKQRAAVGVNDA